MPEGLFFLEGGWRGVERLQWVRLYNGVSQVKRILLTADKMIKKVEEPFRIGRIEIFSTVTVRVVARHPCLFAFTPCPRWK